MKRLKLGLCFFGNYKTWAGGVIYMLNIINALNLLNDDLKPELYIFHNQTSPIDDIIKINYPYIKFCEVNNHSALTKLANFIWIKLFGRAISFKDKVDVVYPYVKFLHFGKQSFFWVPDFQEYYFPELFSKEEIIARAQRHKYIAKSKGIVVLSSQNAINDFKKFYPHHTCETKLLRFACILPEYKHVVIETLKEKYNIGNNYFVTPNQFWKHKNHKIILEAIVALKQKNLNFQAVFTGSPKDRRNKEYFTSLEEYVKENGIERNVVFLGFIDRDEQLMLMKNSLAIIQPSLFEGWSTVVEDAKALNHFIIVSNIDVHKEQISENCSFFEPNNPVMLAEIIEKVLEQKPEPVYMDYTRNIQNFGKELLDIFQSK
ncbi:glycosyltransferase [Mucilaginibacter boryungensis]|uniref:Glycosyltransferase n=1 Tax=Mucilaginibacter boryungensis TaxID=768480 RepID=A0ABR9XKX3_9SPHI|nr:glycosyltransferase [Mucilaginibacter boryungensis]MBE9667895.1 glycosyltransferase [Mucilaginibacter boryungensis]